MINKKNQGGNETKRIEYENFAITEKLLKCNCIIPNQHKKNCNLFLRWNKFSTYQINKL